VILADSSILIEWQRVPSANISSRRIAAEQEAAICGVTVAEVLQGARSSLERTKLSVLLSAFRRLAIEEEIWDLTGDLSARLRSRGTPLAIPDLAIAATAIYYSLPLWTRDAHFHRVQGVAPELILFDESNA
jgi:predicted nucleic acid-binding protein